MNERIYAKPKSLRASLLLLLIILTTFSTSLIAYTDSKLGARQIIRTDDDFSLFDNSKSGLIQNDIIKNFNDTIAKIKDSQQFATVLTCQDSLKCLKWLEKEINKILSGKALSGCKYGLAIYSLDGNKYIYSNNSDELLTPASCMKLITTYTAFSTLGSSFLVNTSVYTDGSISNDSILNGNIYLVGHGDALLSSTDIDTIASMIIRKGIKEIHGSFFADGSYFDSATDRFIYSGDKDRVEDLQPITGLSIDKNILTIKLNGTNSKNANYTITPNSSAIVINKKASSPQKDKFLKTELEIPSLEKVEQTLPSVPIYLTDFKIADEQLSTTNNQLNQTGGDVIYASLKNQSNQKSVSRNVISRKKSRTKKNITSRKKGARYIVTNNKISYTSQDGRQYLTLPTGVNRRGSFYQFHLKDPAIVAAGTLENALIELGIKVNCITSLSEKLKLSNISTQPSGNKDCYVQEKFIHLLDTSIKPKLLASFNRQIKYLIREANKFSDNYIAENLFKLLGAHPNNLHKNHPALIRNYQLDNALEARQTIKNMLTGLGVDCSKFELNDGSGLSRRNRITADVLVKILQSAYKHNDFEKFDSTLSTCGIDGTLRKRLKSTKAEGNLHGKTGTLRNVSALAGYISTQDDEKLAFAFIFNGARPGNYKRVEDSIAKLLSEFFYRRIE